MPPESKHGDHRAAGDEKTVQSRVYGAGSEMLQSEGPIPAIHAHLCGFHFYNRDLKRAVRAGHYCAHLNEEVFQCVIHDSAERDARLIGVERADIPARPVAASADSWQNGEVIQMDDKLLKTATPSSQ